MLAPAEAIERADQFRDERDRPDLAALGGLLGLGGLRPRAADVDALAREVDVPEPERQQLALTQAGVRGREVQGRVLDVVGVPSERGDLVTVERLELAAVADGGTVDQFGAGRVADEAMSPHSVLEDTVRDGEVPDDGAGRQPRGHVVVAQGLHVGGADGSDRPGPQRGSK